MAILDEHRCDGLKNDEFHIKKWGYMKPDNNWVLERNDGYVTNVYYCHKCGKKLNG